MLAELRRHSKSVIIYVLFGLIIVVFVLGFNMMGSKRRGGQGIPTVDRDSAAELVKVGQSVIDTVDLEMGLRLTIDPPRPGQEPSEDMIRQAMAYMRTRFQRFPGDQRFMAFGTDPRKISMIKYRKVADDLIETWLVSGEARKNGLIATPEEVRDRIVSQFTDPTTGEFKAKYYEDWVRWELKSTFPQFEDFVAREIEREKMIGLVTAGQVVPEREARFIAAQRKNVRSYEFLEISPSLLAAAVVGTDREVKAWMKSNTEKARKYFDDHASEFAVAAGYDFHVLKYTDEARANEAASGLKGLSGGELKDAIETLARAGSEDAQTRELGGRAMTALTTDAIATLYGNEVAAAMEGLVEMQASPVIKSSQGWFIVMLDSRRPAVEADFERSFEVIARKLIGEEKAASELEALSARAIEALSAAPDVTMVDAAGQLNAAYAPHSPVRVGETGDISAIPDSIGAMIDFNPGVVSGLGKADGLVDDLKTLTPTARVLAKPVRPEGSSSVFVVRLKSDVSGVEPTAEDIDQAAAELGLFKRLAMWREWFDALRANAAASGELVEFEMLTKKIADEERARDEAAAASEGNVPVPVQPEAPESENN